MSSIVALSHTQLASSDFAIFVDEESSGSIWTPLGDLPMLLGWFCTIC